MPPRAFRMRVDVADDASDAFRNRRGFEVEELRTGDGNMGEGPIDLEEMQAVRGELPAEEGGQLQRKIFLPFPVAAHKLLQFPAPQVAAQNSGGRRPFQPHIAWGCRRPGRPTGPRWVARQGWTRERWLRIIREDQERVPLYLNGKHP